MGRSKAWLPFPEEPLLERMVRLVAEAVAPVVVVAARDQKVPSLADEIELIHDEQDERGPLGGILWGLKALHGRADAAFVCACDVPFLRPGFVQRLIDLIGDKMACVPHVDGHYHPLTAVYRLEVAETAAWLVAGGRLSVIGLIESVPVRLVTAAEIADIDPRLDSIQNLNSPLDYELAQKKVRKTKG
jgi:molybdopterin-guanine dinucleotide biosynthesis protein A